MLSADTVGAFVDYPEITVEHNVNGALSGLSFAVKDIFDVKDYPTGCGTPIKRAIAEQNPATKTAPTVAALLEAGARFMGKTHTDELAFSLNGINAHYGAPINVAAPGRITGGSSCGSAAAVAAGLVDFATGSDTGGSIRAPASYCGLVGLRPTWGRLSLEGTMPLAKSYDTFGWFARDMATYKKIASSLFNNYEEPTPFKRLIIADDIMNLMMGEEQKQVLNKAIHAAEEIFGAAEHITLAPQKNGLEDWYWIFRRTQGFEAWQSHGQWIEKDKPTLGPGVKERFEYGKTMTKTRYEEDQGLRNDIRQHLGKVLGSDGLLLLPTVPDIAPKRDDSNESLETFRNRALTMLCISGLTGVPQINLPIVSYNNCPLGVSLMANAGKDRALIRAGDLVMQASAT